MGNHYHILLRFNEPNKAAFFRDLNARIAEAVRACVKEFVGGKLLGERYADQALPEDADTEDKFFYAALQPVSSGLTERVSEYPAYNSFQDASTATVKEYEVVDWAAYNSRRRYNKSLSIKDFTKSYPLVFTRLPGYEDLSYREYRQYLLKQLELRRVKVVNARKKEGKGFAGPEALAEIRPGSKPAESKKRKRGECRPVVISSNREARAKYLDWYFRLKEKHAQASERYRKGDWEVEFPEGTYPPPGCCCHTEAVHYQPTG
jgi:hypothetical protein